MSAAWRVLRQQILRRGGGFSGHGERPFHLHPPSTTIRHGEHIFHPSHANDDGPFASFLQSAVAVNSIRQQQRRRLTIVTPAPSEPRTINSGMVSQGRPVRGLVTRKPDQQHRSEAGGRRSNLQGWRLNTRQQERREATSLGVGEGTRFPRV